MIEISSTYPDRTLNIPHEELSIIRRAIHFHMRRHNLKPHGALPDIWFCEASDSVVILRTYSKEIARYRYGVSNGYWFEAEQPSIETPHGDLIRAAISSYYRRCLRRGDIYQQPSPEYSDVTDGIIVLCNRHGEIARYKQNKTRNQLEYTEVS